MLSFYWVTNQYVTQRVLAARSIEHARRGILLAGFLKLLPLFIMVLPGAMAIALLPPIDNPDQIFALMVTEFLPIGITGLVLAGIISAILSSVDSILYSASTLIIKDFVQPARPGLAPTAVVRWGRLTTLCLMVVAVVWAPMITHFGGLWAYL